VSALRVALAALLALALVAATLPAVETARVERTDAALDREGDRLDRAAASLVRTSEAAAAGDARRTVVLRLPGRSWGSAGVDAEVADGSLRWRLSEGRWRERRLTAVVVPEPIALSAGRNRLRLALVRRGGRAAVAVRPFKSDTEASPAHGPARSVPRERAGERL